MLSTFVADALHLQSPCREDDMAVTRPAKTFSQTERRRILLGAGALCLGILALAAFSC